jgi:hypothetical protein
MTSEDPKFKLIAIISITLILFVMGIYELRKKALIHNHVKIERLKLEKVLSEHEKAKQQIEILQQKNQELEKLRVERSKHP